MSAPGPVSVRVKRLAHGEGLALPAYESAAAAGLDLRAAVDAAAPVIIPPGARALVPTGLALEIPDGFEGQVRARSGLAVRHGIGILNAPGTIDADYRGEIKVLLVNLGDAPFVVERGMRVAQLVIAPVARAQLSVTTELAGSARGTGGFGSTGTAG